jgi:lactoylglutathione lyase
MDDYVSRVRAFPVVYTKDVPRLIDFYERIGFTVTFRFPPDDEQGYASLSRDGSDLGIVHADFPREQIGVEVGDGPRFEMFVYVDGLDEFVEGLGAPVLKAPMDMPWGERIAYVSDPEGNPVVLAQPSEQSS